MTQQAIGYTCPAVCRESLLLPLLPVKTYALVLPPEGPTRAGHQEVPESPRLILLDEKTLVPVM